MPRTSRLRSVTGLVALLGLLLGVLALAAPARAHAAPARARTAPAAPSTGTPAVPGLDDLVRLNQIQVIGSHNSYHQEATSAEEQLRAGVEPGEEVALEYGHLPLAQQFSWQRVRQIELDVHLDSKGGLYANPVIRQLLGEGPLPYEAEMEQPGIKVFHVHDVDYLATCHSLVSCLTEVRQWSLANPSHVPIMILVELVDAPIPGLPANLAALQTTEEPWTVAGMHELNTEISSVFPPSEMITPDDIRGPFSTLQQSIATQGSLAWPTLAQSRGKVLFTMDNGGSYRDTYLAAFPNLQGADLFPDAPDTSPLPSDAGFIEMNDPTGANQAAIQQLVTAGYVVRTRADADTVQARADQTTMRDLALSSGAQWVSTDYPVPGWAGRFASPYYAALPSGTTARCNPVNAPEICAGQDANLDTVPITVPPDAWFVKKVYGDLIGTGPTAADTGTWVEVLNHFGLDGRRFLAFVAARSDQYAGTLVRGLYADAFGRAPDPGGLAYWAQQIVGGNLSVEQVAAYLFGAPEGVTHLGHGDLGAWVQGLYQQVLGRTGDSAGVSFWTQRAGQVGTVTVAYEFERTTEAAGRRVDALYQALLDRPADAGGRAAWIPVLLASGDQSVAAGIVSSNEYYGLAQP